MADTGLCGSSAAAERQFMAKDATYARCGNNLPVRSDWQLRPARSVENNPTLT
jgi:hypothetical protein